MKLKKLIMLGQSSLAPATCSADGYVCNWCDKKVKTYVPKGGDGSAKVVMSHKNKRGELCNGSWKLLPWA